ncbi:hypothetical protein B0I35DRAFT_472914 [Stachybotrys elegans]|uniref:Actin-like ATPase domain-containing protein n=1 Tax=Stachybotrys elegans TaxID=80388 RepID=A0A8K0WW08_9HYPO|nr:hypothetical protein B0I35DRAFT_472914 [Stachybotrys elegans]
MVNYITSPRKKRYKTHIPPTGSPSHRCHASAISTVSTTLPLPASGDARSSDQLQVVDEGGHVPAPEALLHQPRTATTRDATDLLKTPQRQAHGRRDSQVASPTPSRRKKRASSPSIDDPPLHTPTRSSRRRHESKSSLTSDRTTGRALFTMASSAGKWREEQILIVCPGSRTTMAQLGCSELTPPAHRIPTRMFKDGNEWRPYYTFKRTKTVNGVQEEEWVEDVDEDKGAVWPIQAGRIVQMDAFLAFLDHVHGMLTTTYHNTPIMLMASPQWTRPDCETIAQYIFEKTKTPALCMIHSGIATQYGLKSPHMTVVDIGYEKVDVTAIFEGRVMNHRDVSAGLPGLDDGSISGGEVFTQSLLRKLNAKGFGYDMAEQLKKSPICEVLPYAPGEANLVELPKEAPGTGAPAPASAEPVKINEPLRPTELNGDDGEGGGDNPEDDGVLDVAAIVTSGQTKEFLAKKEKEKGKGGRKGKDKDDSNQKAPRLPNSKRAKNIFSYEEIIQEEVQPNPPSAPPAEKAPAVEAQPESKAPDATQEGSANAGSAPEPPKPAEGTNGAAPKEDIKPEATAVTNGGAAPAQAADASANGTSATTETTTTIDPPERRAKRVRRDVEVGLERFTFAEREEIDRIVTAIYRTIQGIEHVYMRPSCWENLVFVGNGARLRGLKENILQTLNARHLISPSTATMFMSELPSNMPTPMGTGSQTPTGSFTGAPHQLPSGGVKPLLQVATTASGMGAAAMTPQPGSDAGGGPGGHHSHSHSQTPTSIKTPSLPTYLGEWTKNGFEESMFLGAQVAARIAFCLHSNMDAQSIEAQRLMSLNRVDYNELGPKAIRTHSMLN